MIDHMPRYERLWLMLGIGSIVVFLIILGILGFSLGLHPPGHSRTIAPESVATSAPFNQPTLEQIGQNEYRATMVAQLFSFLPADITVPKGSTIHFEITSPDVVHGLLIPKTNVNIMVVPGLVTQYTHTFKESGDYLVLCNEYCGIGHQVMMGKIIVQ